MKLAVENWGKTAGWVIVNNDAEPDGETGTAWYRLYGPQLPERAGGASLDRLFQLARAVGTKVRWRDYRDRFLARR